MDSSPDMPKYYREEANRLLAKYYPIEVDPKMTEEEKIPYMEEWYQQIHNLLVKCNISQASIKGMVSASSARLRLGSTFVMDSVKLCFISRMLRYIVLRFSNTNFQ